MDHSMTANWRHGVGSDARREYIQKEQIMDNTLSFKLQEDTFNEVEKITHKMKIPRNTYINNALEFYNEFVQRKLLRHQLEKESKLVRVNSMEISASFIECQK